MQLLGGSMQALLPVMEDRYSEPAHQSYDDVVTWLHCDKSLQAIV